MKTQVCAFSGFKVYPGRGMRFVRGDGRSFVFFSNKCSSKYYAKRNPRECTWTLLYRQLHRKSQTEEVAKRKVHKVVRAERAVAGMSLEEIRLRRNQKPEVRQAARDAALKELKAKRLAVAAKKAEAKKAAAAAAAAAAAPKKQQAKQTKQAARAAKPAASKQKAPKSTAKASR